MDTSSLVEFDASSELEKIILSHDSLRPGDKLEGKILEIKKNGKVLISFGKFRAVADITFPIKIGEVLPVIVESKEARLRFRVEAPHRRHPPPVRREEQVFHFSLPLKERKQKAKLKMYIPKKGNSKKGLRLSLLLDMDRLGETRIDFFIVDKNLNITFFVKNHEIKERMEADLTEIGEALDIFFHHLVLNVIVSRKKIAGFVTEDLDVAVTNTRMVDVKV